MNAVNMPGFTAEAALLPTTRTYYKSSAETTAQGIVVPALPRDKCRSYIDQMDFDAGMANYYFGLYSTMDSLGFTDLANHALAQANAYNSDYNKWWHTALYAGC